MSTSEVSDYSLAHVKASLRDALADRARVSCCRVHGTAMPASVLVHPATLKVLLTSVGFGDEADEVGRLGRVAPGGVVSLVGVTVTPTMQVLPDRCLWLFDGPARQCPVLPPAPAGT